MLAWLRNKFLLLILALFITVFTALGGSLALFTLLEFFPDLLGNAGTNALPYYALRHRYEADPVLIFRNKPDLTFIGSLGAHAANHPILGKGFTPVPYVAHFNRDGFRPATMPGIPEIAMIGDSFIEIGERDDTTLPALLSATLGQPVLNLGTSWYGPHQYLELFKRHIITHKPKIVFFSFFAGNDISDIKSFLQFKKTGTYYGFNFYRADFLSRYTTVLSQSYTFVSKLIREKIRVPIARFRGRHQDGLMGEAIHIKLGDSSFWDTFIYEPDTRSIEALTLDPAWLTLAKILDELKIEALKTNTSVVVLYIPSKLEIYAPYCSEKSGTRFKAIREKLLTGSATAEALLKKLTIERDLFYVSTTPVLNKVMEQGSAPFYRYDTHWNEIGRKATATYLADFIAALPQSSAAN